MSATMTTAAVAVSALLTACQSGDQPALTPSSQPPRSAGADRNAATRADRELVRSLVAFARSPTESAWRKLALARRVEIGLGTRLVSQRSARELRDPERWTIDAKRFRGAVGPFSALRLIAGEPRPLHVSVGPHAHCVSPPVPPPQRVANLKRLSVQPRNPDSCLSWWTVDVYVNADGEVRAVTLDHWEP